jgi:hypothetical protein
MLRKIRERCLTGLFGDSAWARHLTEGRIPLIRTYLYTHPLQKGGERCKKKRNQIRSGTVFAFHGRFVSGFRPGLKYFPDATRVR